MVGSTYRHLDVIVDSFATAIIQIHIAAAGVTVVAGTDHTFVTAKARIVFLDGDICNSESGCQTAREQQCALVDFIMAHHKSLLN